MSEREDVEALAGRVDPMSAYQEAAAEVASMVEVYGDGPWYAECGHGSDDLHSCFGCQYGSLDGLPLSLGPHLPPKPPRTVRYAPSFVQAARDLGARRFPLRAVPDSPTPLGE